MRCWSGCPVAVVEPTVPCTVIVTLLPAATVPSGQLTAPAVMVHEPCVGDADERVSPATAGSETLTFAASDGPLLATLIV